MWAGRPRLNGQPSAPRESEAVFQEWSCRGKTLETSLREKPDGKGTSCVSQFSSADKRVGQGGAGCRPSVHRGLPWVRSPQWTKNKSKPRCHFSEDRISPCAGWGNSHNSFRHRPPQKWPKGQAEVKSPSALAWQHELPFSEHTCNKCGINSSSSVLHTGVSALAGPQKEGRKQLPPQLPVSLGTGKAQWAVTAAATSLL